MDAAAALLVPRKGDVERARRLAACLGLEPNAPEAPWSEDDEAWMAERMSRQPEITHLRDDVDLILAQLGGIATLGEIAAALLARRGSAATGDAWRNEALAVTRAVITVERSKQGARWQLLSRATQARAMPEIPREDDLAVAAEHGADGLFPPAPEARAAYAFALGEAADRLGQLDPLASPKQAADTLARVPAPPGAAALPAERVLRLAAACARQAALSPLLEFYPVGLPASRAIKLAANTLIGLRQFELETLRRRILARYPEAAPLPGTTELERLLRDAGLDVAWDSTKRAFVIQFTGAALSGTSQLGMLTASGRPRTATAPNIQAAQQVDDRIRQALASGKLLTLSVDRKGYSLARQELARRFDLAEIDFDELVLELLSARRGNGRWTGRCCWPPTPPRRARWTPTTSPRSCAKSGPGSRNAC